MTTCVGSASTSSPSRKEIMMLNRSTQPSGNCKLNRRLLGLLILVVSAVPVALGEPRTPNAKLQTPNGERRTVIAENDRFFLILDPYFYRSPLVLPVDGTKETVLTFYRAVDDATLTPAKPDELSDGERAAVKVQTEIHARKLLEVIKPEIVRNTKGVITALGLYS